MIIKSLSLIWPFNALIKHLRLPVQLKLFAKTFLFLTDRTVINSEQPNKMQVRDGAVPGRDFRANAVYLRVLDTL